LEALRFHEHFQFDIRVSSELDQEDTFIPPLIIQPYVENAIWHGLLQKNAPGNLEVTIERKNGFVHVEVTDDGIGRKAAEALHSKSATKKSFGTQITRDRIALVRQIIGIDASVNTYDLQKDDGSPGGTRVVIEIPHITAAKIDQLNLN
jgi:sensor histidine kinase YesM